MILRQIDNMSWARSQQTDISWLTSGLQKNPAAVAAVCNEIDAIF